MGQPSEQNTAWGGSGGFEMCAGIWFAGAACII